jgi:UDP-glucuronate 4-epimerase
VKKFIFASSSSVYGSNVAPFREDYLLKPLSPYAASKVAGEALCHAFHHAYGMPCACLRFFTVYGPRQRPEMAIHKFTRAIDEGQEIPVFDGGKSTRDYTYIDDIVDGIIASIHGEGFEIFNLGNGGEVRLTELITLIEEALGKKARIRLEPHQRGDVLSTRACILKAQERMSYFPRVDIREGINRFVDWYRVRKSSRPSQVGC